MTVGEKPLDLSPFVSDLVQLDLLRWRGVVKEVTGLLVESEGPATALGSFCEIQTKRGRVIRTQVQGFRNGRILSIPLEETEGLEPGDFIYARPAAAQVRVGPDLLGRVLDGFGKPIDGGGPIRQSKEMICLLNHPGRCSASTSRSLWQPEFALSKVSSPAVLDSASASSVEAA